MLNPKQRLFSRCPGAMDPRDRKGTKLTEWPSNARCPTAMQREVVVVGVSVRAAVQALARLGYRSIAIDAFGDWDTRQAAYRTHPIASYPQQIEGALQRYPGVPFLYTGGLENRPEWLRRWQRWGPLWGVPHHQVRALRDPRYLSEVLQRGGFEMPPIALTAPREPAESWLRKARRSAGGYGVISGQFDPSRPQQVGRSPGYWQVRIEGQVRGGVFSASPAACHFLGETGAIAEIWEPAASPSTPFAYRGSWGPVPPCPTRVNWWRRLGNHLAEFFRLRGIFGVDVIWDGDCPWVLEVNPRWPSSAEILDRACGANCMEWHVGQFDAARRQSCHMAQYSHFATRPSVGARQSAPQPPTYAAKFVVFADQTRIASVDFCDWTRRQQAYLADLPIPGSVVRAGSPLLTVFADGQHLDTLRQQLSERTASVREQWAGTPSNPG